MKEREPLEFWLNISHHVVGYLVVGMTLFAFFDKKGHLPLWQAGISVAIGIVGVFLKTSNDAAVVSKLRDNRKAGREILYTNGYYKHVRNPCYIAQILIITGFFVIAPSLFGIIVLGVYFFSVHLTVHAEEKRLLKKFGRQYRMYTQTVPRWIPKFQIPKTSS